MFNVRDIIQSGKDRVQELEQQGRLAKDNTISASQKGNDSDDEQHPKEATQKP